MNTLIEAYLIAFFIFIHFSLILCEQPTCFFDAKQFTNFIPMGVYKFIVSIFNLVPVKLEAIQLVAQFCLFGDLILLILLLLKIVGSILRNLLVILGITAFIMVIVYTLSNFDQSLTGNFI